MQTRGHQVNYKFKLGMNPLIHLICLTGRETEAQLCEVQLLGSKTKILSHSLGLGLRPIQPAGVSEDHLLGSPWPQTSLLARPIGCLDARLTHVSGSSGCPLGRLQGAD